MGASAAGINLAMANIGYKLAPKNESITYISTRSMITSLFAAIAPVIAGLFADFFADQNLSWNIEWKGSGGNFSIPILDLQSWDFFFVIGTVLAFLSLHRLSLVNEEGEINKKVWFFDLKTNFKNKRRSKTEALKGFLARQSAFVLKRRVKKPAIAPWGFDKPIKEVA